MLIDNKYVIKVKHLMLNYPKFKLNKPRKKDFENRIEELSDLDFISISCNGFY